MTTQDHTARRKTISMNTKLAIYACSGVGDTSGGDRTLTYYLEGTNTASNTQAQNNLLSMLNESNTTLNYLCTTDEQRAKVLSSMDLYAVCFYFAEEYKDDHSKLEAVGCVINDCLDSGMFNTTSPDVEEHDQSVTALIEYILAYDLEQVAARDTFFVKWYNENVLSLNKVGLSKRQQEEGEKALQESINGTDDQYGDISTYLNDAGSYFLYLYFTDEQIKQLPRIFRIKRRKQQEVYNYCLKVFTDVYGTQDSMNRIIRNGIIQDYKDTPENVVNTIYKSRGKGADKGVSGPITWQVIVAIIAAITMLLMTVILGVINYAKAIQVAKYTVPENADTAVPDDEVQNWIDSKNKSNRFWLIGGVSALALVLMRSKRK